MTTSGRTLLAPGEIPTASASPAEPAAQRAYDETKRRIIRGDIAGGTWLSEVVVCQELGLSRTPVHEAFLRLAAEELLSLEARKGALVRALSPSEVTDVVEMREAIESTAARRAIANADAGLDAALASLLEQQQRCSDSGDVDGFVDADDAFHSAVVAASQNGIATQFTNSLRDRAQRVRHQAMRLRPSDLAAALDDHRRLAAAVAARDADAYSAVLNEHVRMLLGAR